MVPERLELSTSELLAQHSNRLSYGTTCWKSFLLMCFIKENKRKIQWPPSSTGRCILPGSRLSTPLSPILRSEEVRIHLPPFTGIYADMNL